MHGEDHYTGSRTNNVYLFLDMFYMLSVINNYKFQGSITLDNIRKHCSKICLINKLIFSRTWCRVRGTDVKHFSFNIPHRKAPHIVRSGLSGGKGSIVPLDTRRSGLNALLPWPLCGVTPSCCKTCILKSRSLTSQNVCTCKH